MVYNCRNTSIWIDLQKPIFLQTQSWLERDCELFVHFFEKRFSECRISILILPKELRFYDHLELHSAVRASDVGKLRSIQDDWILRFG